MSVSTAEKSRLRWTGWGQAAEATDRQWGGDRKTDPSGWDKGQKGGHCMCETLFWASTCIVSVWRGHYCSHFTDEETEDPGSEASPLRLHRKIPNWDGTPIWK